jgi:hypothetical protein
MTNQQRSCPIPDLVVNVCPTSSCISCARIYTNEITGHKIVCRCNCHSETLGAEAAKLLNDKDVGAKDGQACKNRHECPVNGQEVAKACEQ